MASLVDTNILVYCCDAGHREKQEAARHAIRVGTAKRELHLPHQALIEFISVVTRPRKHAGPLLPLDEAARQAEELMEIIPVLYPNQAVFRLALRGKAIYGLAWYDAHLWAYAEHFGIGEILSEDFEHGRKYGAVRVTNPFVGLE